MQQQELIPHLFRTEYSKLTVVLTKLFGLEHIEIAEDIASDTFLLATETWSFKGLPENPTAWLYAVAKNKAKDYLKRNTIFHEKVKKQIHPGTGREAPEIDLSNRNITDSQLQMMFAICHPSIPAEAQVGLALRILCGFGIEEIANAFLTNKETTNKRLFRAKEKLRTEGVKMEFPGREEINGRLQTVLTTLYLLFNEGYFSISQDTALRKDLCLEAMRLTHLLTQSPLTNTPAVSALLSLMCFHSSRFEARTSQSGEAVLYQDQDTGLWNIELINQGKYYLAQASKGSSYTKYHIEASIAYWHTIHEDTAEKWQGILMLYNQLLQLEYSPIAALNRTFALSKVKGNAVAIAEAEKLNLDEHPLYHSLLGELYIGIEKPKALEHLRKALELTKGSADRRLLEEKILGLG